MFKQSKSPHDLDPVDAWHNDNVFITSKPSTLQRRFGVILTSLLRHAAVLHIVAGPRT